MAHREPADLEQTFAEFFAGIGLMRLGLESRGWSISFANDIDPDKHEMYRAHFRDKNEHLNISDIHTVESDAVPTVALATASFPCNDLSLAGAREGLSGEQSSAFWGFIRILRENKDRRPPIILLENVTGFLTSNDGLDFENALIALNRLGYAVDPFIVDAAHFVPQSRERLFVVGTQSEFRDTHHLKERFYESQARPKALADFIFDHPGIHWNIRPLPKLPTLARNLRSIIEELPENAPQWWNRERSEYLLNQMSARHRTVAEKMIQGNDWSYGTVFRRIRNDKSMAELRTDGIAGCLRTPRGGSGRQILFKAGNGQYHVRLLTPRECARLMGADNFVLQSDLSLNQALFGFGDAVCVPVVEWIADHYLNPVFEALRKANTGSANKTLAYA